MSGSSVTVEEDDRVVIEGGVLRRIEAPRDWPRRFEVARWGLFAARIAGRRVGGAVVAFDTPGLSMLGGRVDLAVLWDIRRVSLYFVSFMAGCPPRAPLNASAVPPAPRAISRTCSAVRRLGHARRPAIARPGVIMRA